MTDVHQKLVDFVYGLFHDGVDGAEIGGALIGYAAMGARAEGLSEEDFLKVCRDSFRHTDGMKFSYAPFRPEERSS